MIYCDTSILLSLYCRDDLSEVADRWFDALTEPVCWTALHQLEFTSGLAARVGHGDTSRGSADAIHTELVRHQGASGFLIECQPESWSRLLKHASDLARAQGPQFQSRSLDVLHVANCLELGIDPFWTLDRRQAKLAKFVGLEVTSQAASD